ncbi:S-layer homology domain-containing protein [Aneurinibacillus migulanus]|uniref:Uncharacterized Sugar-binding Domain n=1 Tax=Aneurinibacillus migulanus TaxID=47500 RepID=A0A0D1Y4D7_ANEMI|nr:S-layer homology domain-containing protein [Aneurinibacillus migulanus]KIV54107.1 hypothetical protein TS65_19405 [Aneurinibacillus migulanus]KON97620.1 hypothetical protein AF333_21395 [Aneurinibacillus migulanus]MED0895416.1 S-layer homology domain-containing protein [Aneurinibacillus migulanus]MED1619678.1 S-layer homology domain-containing protein [Aneurinibacillus migulanus]SDJ37732.1 Uncharacterised Sugar-binding Domain [Aneurinibacillus migulanus]
MLTRRKKNHWMKRLSVSLVFALVAGSFSGTLVPREVSASVVGPGGVSNANLWLKAEDATTTSDSVSLAGWEDRTGTNTFTVTGAPEKKENGVNFNPVVKFTNTAPKTTLPNQNLAGDKPITYMDGYAVFKSTGNMVGSTQKMAHYSAAIFANEGGLSVGNGTNYTYHIFKFNDASRYHLVAFDISEKNSPVGRLDGKNQTITKNGGFESVTFTPMIGGGDGANNPGNWQHLNGEVAEIILFDHSTNVDRNKIESYLAVKYGITLNNGASDYVDTASSVVWTADATYKNNIAGIGRDDVEGLNQKQSLSINDGTQVTIGLGSIAASNKENANTFSSDKQYLIWGDNGKDLTFDRQVGSQNLYHAQRVWKVQNTNSVGAVQVAIPKSEITTGDSVKLLVSDNDTDFSGATQTLLTEQNVNGSEYYVANIPLDNHKYFTFAVTTEVTTVDKSVLQAKVTEINGENLKETDYTPESWTKLQGALKTANDVLSNPNATQAEIENALTVLTAARNGLSPVGSVDKSALQAKVNEINGENLKEADYTPESWTKLQEALTAANNVLSNPNATQAEVENALSTLTAARTGLTPVDSVDKSALQTKVSAINHANLNEADYTPASWQILQDVLTVAQTVLNDPATNQAEVDRALKALETALEGLVPSIPDGVNKAALQVKVAEVDHENLKKADYTPASWQTLQDALTVARTVLNDPDATQADVDAAKAALDTARNGLKPVPATVDKTVLQAKVNAINGENLKEADYTSDSWQALQSALNTANSVLADPDASQAKVDVALKALTAARTGLTPVGTVDKSALQAKVTEINGENLKEANYTSASWKTLQDALTEANKILTDPNATQTQVKAALDALTSARNGLSRISSGGGSGGSSKDRSDRGGNTNTNTDTNTGTPTGIKTTVDNTETPFATGTTTKDGERTNTKVTINPEQLSTILAKEKGQNLKISVPNDGTVEVQGLTVGAVKKLADTNSSLKIESPLASYPVPSAQLNLDAIEKQFNGAKPSDIMVNIHIQRSSDTLTEQAHNVAKESGYELLVNPVNLEATFTNQGQTVKAGELNGYATKYIALPEGVDRNRITTGVVVNPDGTVFHVPTVVTKIGDRYYAQINDLHSHANYSVIWNPKDFSDVKNHWAKEDINDIAARLDLAGTGNNTFSPNRNVNRSEFATIVATGLGLLRQNTTSNVFSDVPASAWYHDAVSIANEFGIVAGYNDGKFHGEEQITREQGFVMIAGAYNLIKPQSSMSASEIEAKLSEYGDAKDVSTWAKEAVARMISAGILKGDDKQLLSPKSNMTRAEAAALMKRVLKTNNLID